MRNFQDTFETQAIIYHCFLNFHDCTFNNETFNISFWNKTKNSSCSCNTANTVAFAPLEPLIEDHDFLHSNCVEFPAHDNCFSLSVLFKLLMREAVII